MKIVLSQSHHACSLHLATVVNDHQVIISCRLAALFI